MRALPIREANGAAEPSEVADDTPGDNGAPFMEVAEALAYLEALIERVAANHPQDRPAILVTIRKLRADLLNLEKRIAAE
jgi:hypothetical protein